VTPWQLIIVVATAAIGYAPVYGPYLGIPAPNPITALTFVGIVLVAVSLIERATYAAAMRAAAENGAPAPSDPPPAREPPREWDDSDVFEGEIE